jgi:hypothetical protein
LRIFSKNIQAFGRTWICFGRRQLRVVGKDITEDKQKSEQCEDIVKEQNKKGQRTMDKMSVDTSEVHTYDKNRADDSEKCS